MSRFQLPTAAAALLFTVWAPGVVAAAESIPVVPPEPEQIAVRAGSDSASKGAASASQPEDPVSEVLRLRGEIRANRDRIEALRLSDLKRADEAYQSALASIAPKDMFETEAEHLKRDVQEKSEAALEKAKSESAINQKYDALLRSEVEPLFQSVRTLLDGADVVSSDDIEVDLEKYDPEHGVFIGSLAVHTGLVDLEAQLFVPMKRNASRTFWKNKDSLIGRMSLAMDVHSLDILIEEFWLEDPQSAHRTEERIAVIEVVSPPEAVSPSEEQRRRADGLRSSASSLAKRSAQGARHCCRDESEKAKGWIAEYNRLVGEAKAVFAKDPHVQGLKTLSHGGSNSQAAGAVTTAAGGLEAYMTSFVSHEALKASASSLAKRSAQGARHCCRDESEKAKGWIAEYNRLVGEAKAVFAKDPHVQGLKTLSHGGSNSQAAGAVTTAARGLEAYMTSFVSHEALKASASSLAKRSAQGARDCCRDESEKAKGWIAEYNRLVGEAKAVFAKDPHVQGLKTLSYGGSNPQAAGAVTTAAGGLEAYMTSFVSHEALKASASSLAKRSAQGAQAVNPYESKKAKGWIAEYNRLVGEAKAVFAKDPHVQGLKTLSYGGSNPQAANAVTAATRSFKRVMENVEEMPRSVAAAAVAETVVQSPNYTPLNHLPYSGRFSPDAIKLAGLLGRWFSPDAKDESGWTDLHYAAALNLPGLASALLEAGADPEARLKSDGQPFGSELAGALSAFGRDLDGDDLGDWTRNGQTPLHFAAWFNAALAAPHLIAGGSKVDPTSSAARTPLYLAAWENSRDLAEFMIGRGADVRAASRNSWTPLDYAIYRKASETAAMLHRHGAQCNRDCQ